MSFRREKFVPRGGPDGGDGGAGGSIYALSDRNLNTLIEYRNARIHRARDGGRGRGSDCYNGRGAPAFWNRKGSVESGDTRTRTLYWLVSLKEMGPPDFSVTADTPLFSVFKDKNGARTYLAYNARDAAIRVTFSTGKTVEVPPRSLVRSR